MFRRKAKWVLVNGRLYCSQCDKEQINKVMLRGEVIYDMTIVGEYMRYCPSCGAYMRGEEGANN